MQSTPRYALVQRVLHWVIAISVLGLIVLGLVFGILGYEGTVATFGDALTNTLYHYHKSFGVLVLGLMLLRVAVRYNLGAPAPAATLTPFERLASGTVHTLLYAVLLLQPVIGWAATATGGYPIEFFGSILPGGFDKNPALSERLYAAHGLLGFVLLGLVAVHVGAALRHGYVKRDGVLDRISLP